MAAAATVQPGETILTATMVAKADGSAITSGTVNVYVKALTGANSGKWYKNSDSTWQASETANAMTYLSGGAEWSITFTNSPFGDGVWYSVYAKESGGLHVPYGQSLRCQYVPAADSSNRVDVGKVAGTLQTARDLGASVLLSSGTGTGQISLLSGKVSLAAAQAFDNAGQSTPLPTSVRGAYVAEVLADAPAAYYRLGELSGTAAADSSGNAVAGTYHGTYTPGYAGPVAADNDACFAPDGSTGYVSFPAVTLSAAASTTELWFRCAVDGSAGMLLGNSGDTSNYLRVLNATTIRWQGDSAGLLDFTVPALSASAWHHLVVTRSANVTRLYLDGVESSTGGVSSSIAATRDQIGRYYDGGGGFWYTGRVDEVAFYATALSAARIARHYQAALGGVGPVLLAPVTHAGATVPNVTTTATATTVTNGVTLAAAERQTLARLRAGRPTWYVSTDGNNSNAGTSPAAAKLTISAAVAACAAGDLILVGPGTYAESVDLSGKAGVELCGSGEATIVTAAASGSAAVITPGHGTAVRRLCVVNTTVDAATQCVYSLSAPHRVVLEDLYLDSQGIGFELTGDQCRVSRCVVRALMYGGILGGRSATVERCSINVEAGFGGNVPTVATGLLLSYGPHAVRDTTVRLSIDASFDPLTAVGVRVDTNSARSDLSGLSVQVDGPDAVGVLAENGARANLSDSQVYTSASVGTATDLSAAGTGTLYVAATAYASASGNVLGLTTDRTGYLDNLSAGAVATASAQATGNTRILLALPNAAAGASNGLLINGTNTGTVALGGLTSGGTAVSTLTSSALLDALLSGHTTAGTVGKALSDASSSADPLTNPVPGSYATGTAGYALGHQSITVTPLVAAAAGGDPNPRFVTVSQGSAPLIAFTVVDANGDPVDLSAKTVRFIAASQAFGADPEASGLFKYETGGSGITIGGDDDNVASVQFDADDTADALRLAWWLWNVTDNTLLAKGTLDIAPAAFDVT